MDNFLNLLILDDLNYLFNDFLNRNDLRYLNDSFNNFLDDFFDLNNLGYNSEDFKNIVDIDNSHDFLVDHSDDSFVHFQNKSGFSLDFFHFFKKGLD